MEGDFFVVVGREVDHFRLVQSHFFWELLGEEVVVSVSEVAEHQDRRFIFYLFTMLLLVMDIVQVS